MARKQLGVAPSGATDALVNDALTALLIYWGCAGVLGAIAWYCLRWPK